MPRNAPRTQIRTSDLRAHLLFIASDELQGRGIGTPGNALAEKSLVVRIRPARPVLAERTFYQPFTLYSGTLGPENRLTVEQSAGHRKTISPGTDFSPLTLSASDAISGDVVFAGYGISAPRPPTTMPASMRAARLFWSSRTSRRRTRQDRFEGTLLTAYAEPAAKLRAAREHGAIGLLVVADTTQHTSRRRLGDVRNQWPEKPSPRDMTYMLAETVDALRLPAASISADIADNLLGQDDGRQKDAAKRPRSVDEAGKAIDAALGADLQQRIGARPGLLSFTGHAFAVIDISRTPTLARNVIAYIEGAEPSAAARDGGLGAHLDHDGVRMRTVVSTTARTTTVRARLRCWRWRRRSPAWPQPVIGLRGRWCLRFGMAEERGLLGSRVFVTRPLPAGPPRSRTSTWTWSAATKTSRSGEPALPASGDARDANTNTMHLLGYTYSADLAGMVRTRTGRRARDQDRLRRRRAAALLQPQRSLVVPGAPDPRAVLHHRSCIRTTTRRRTMCRRSISRSWRKSRG